MLFRAFLWSKLKLEKDIKTVKRKYFRADLNDPWLINEDSSDSLCLLYRVSKDTWWWLSPWGMSQTLISVWSQCPGAPGAVSMMMMMLASECKSLRKSPDDIVIAESPPRTQSHIPSPYCSTALAAHCLYHEPTINEIKGTGTIIEYWQTMNNFITTRHLWTPSVAPRGPFYKPHNANCRNK